MLPQPWLQEVTYRQPAVHAFVHQLAITLFTHLLLISSCKAFHMPLQTLLIRDLEKCNGYLAMQLGPWIDGPVPMTEPI